MQPVVLTPDYYNYLKTTQSLFLTNIKAILFFRTEPIINEVYQRLIQERASSTCPIQVAWIKCLINLSCGFFGVCSGGKQFKSILTNRLPKNYHYSCHIKNVLAIFVTIVETGKLRLVPIIQFIPRHLSPKNWSLVYSNIDNLIITMRGGGSLDKSVLATAEKSTLESYLPEKPLYLVDQPGQAKPGVAKLECLCNVPCWEFITLTTQHYALVTGNDENDIHKSSGWSGLSNCQAFNHAYQIMFDSAPVIIPQMRRVHKLVSMSVTEKNIVMQPRK